MAVSSVSLRVYPEVLRSIGFASISGTYSGIGTPLNFPARIIMFQNNTDADLFISWDGINNHQFVASQSFTLLDVSTNKVSDQGWYVTAGQRFYVKEISTSPTLGSVYLTVFYGMTTEGV